MYDAREKAIRDYQSAINSAHQEGRQEGRQEGQQIGEQIGEKRGEQRGEERGKQQGALMGKIVTLQEILGLTPADNGTLNAMCLVSPSTNDN